MAVTDVFIAEGNNPLEVIRQVQAQIAVDAAWQTSGSLIHTVTDLGGFWYTWPMVYDAAAGIPANVGTAADGSTASETGTAGQHRTVLTVATTLPAIAGGADLAVGKLLYTFPAGVVIIESSYMSLAITQTEGNITADTPDGGLGTVIASGAVATLDGTGTFEDILTGQTFNDCNGTAEVKTALPTASSLPLIIPAASAHTVHFNVADGWAASGDAGALLTGTVVLNWKFLV